MIILNENLSLKVRLKEAVETNQWDFSVSFWDSTGTSLNEWSYVWKFSNDDVLLCASPAPWVKRVVKWFTISNNDTKTGKFILYVYNWNDEYIICQKSLAAWDSFDSLSAWWAWWGGWMDKALYDPDYIEANVFDMDNMIQWTNKQYVTPDEKTIFNSKQDQLVSWSTIKTFNWESVLWEWDLSLEEVSSQKSIINKEHVAWQRIRKWEFLYEDRQSIADTIWSFAPIELWKTWIPRTAQMIIWDWKYCGDLEVYIKKNRYPSNNIVVRLETDNNWKPSWQLVDLESTFETIYNNEVTNTYRLIKKKLLWNTDATHWIEAWSTSEWNLKWVRLKATETTTISKIRKNVWCTATHVVVRVNNEKFYSWKFSDNVASVNIPVEEWDDIYITFCWANMWVNQSNVAYPLSNPNTMLWSFKIKSGYTQWLLTAATDTLTSNTSNVTIDDVWCRFVPNCEWYLTSIKCFTDATHQTSVEENNIKIYDTDRKTVLSNNVTYDSSTHTYSFSPIYFKYWNAFWVHFPKVVNGNCYNSNSFNTTSFRHTEENIDWLLWQWARSDYIKRPVEINQINYYKCTNTSMWNSWGNNWTNTNDSRYNYYNKWQLFKANQDMSLHWFKYRFSNAVWNFNPFWFSILSKDKTKELTHNIRIERWWFKDRYENGEDKECYNYQTSQTDYFYVSFDPIELHAGDEVWIKAPSYSNLHYYNEWGTLWLFDFVSSWWPTNTTNENTHPKESWTTVLDWALYDENLFYNLEWISTTKKVMLENWTKYRVVFHNWAQWWEVEDPSDYFHLAPKTKPFIDFTNKYYTWSSWELNDNNWIWLWWLKDKTVAYRKIYAYEDQTVSNSNDTELNERKSLLRLAPKNPIVAEDDYNPWDMVVATVYWKSLAYKWLKPDTWYYIAATWEFSNYLEQVWQRAQNNWRPVWYWTSDWHLFVQPAVKWKRVKNAWTDVVMAQNTGYTQTNSSEFVCLKTIQIWEQWWYRISVSVSETTPANSYYILKVNWKLVNYWSHNSWTAANTDTDTFINAWDIITIEWMSTLSTNNARVNNVYVRYATAAVEPTDEHNLYNAIWVKNKNETV